MSVLNDYEIECLSIEHGMIQPYATSVDQGVISYGVSSYGYDFRVAGDFEIFTKDQYPVLIDPKAFDPGPSIHTTREKGQAFLMPPYSFALGVSVECFHIPRDIITLCLNKSTYARCGLYVNITPFEPEWQGHATVELTNPTPRPIAVYPFEGIAQLLFLQAGLNHQEFADMIRQATLDTDVVNSCSVDSWPGGWRPDAGRLICRRSYADKGGKYQHQEKRIVHPKVEGIP